MYDPLRAYIVCTAQYVYLMVHNMLAKALNLDRHVVELLLLLTDIFVN